MNNIVTLANALSSAGYSVTILTVEASRFRPKTLAAEIDLHSALEIDSRERGLSAIFKIGYRIAKFRKATKANIEYIVDSWTLKAYWTSLLFSPRKKTTKLIYHTFDWLEPGLHSKSQFWAERWFSRRSHMNINADLARARMQQTLYQLAVTPTLVKNGLSRAVLLPKPNLSVRQRLFGHLASKRLIIYPTIVSDETSAQRQALELIKSLQYLPTEYSLVLFGSKGTYMDRCESGIQLLGLESRIKFLKPVSFDELLEYLVNCDAGAVLYDYSISSGYFMANADKVSLLAAAGIPFVATSVPNLESIVYKHGIGVCCDSRDPKQIAESLKTLLASDTELSKLKGLCRIAFDNHLCFEGQGPVLKESLSTLC